jgi:ribosomal protein S18 acetylase RimI-like enzyme
VNQPEVTLATPADRDRVVDTVVSAFAADPAFRFFFPDDASYAELAGLFVGHLFDRRMARGTVWIVEGGASVSMWDGPPAPGTAPAQSPPLELPAEVTGRLDAFDAAVHAWLPPTPHWYLGILATHPTYAGRRWGRAAMAAGIERAAAAGLPAYLETANAGNVELYRRAGWEIVRSLTARTLKVWVMSLSPPAARPVR